MPSTALFWLVFAALVAMAEVFSGTFYLLAVALGGYFTWMQLSELQAQLLQRGQMMAEQLAAIAAPALTRNDGALLEQIADESLEHADTRAVRLFDGQHQLLAHAGPRMLNQAAGTPPRHLQVLSNDSATRFQLAVTRRHLTHSAEPDPANPSPPLGWVELELSHDSTLLRGYRSLLFSLLLVFAAAECEPDASPAQRTAHREGQGGVLRPLMCVDKAPDDLPDFNSLARESKDAGPPWQVVFAAALSGRDGTPPAKTEIDAALKTMVEAVRVGGVGRYAAFGPSGDPLHFH